MPTSAPPPPTKAATIGFILDNDCHVLLFKAVIGYSVHFLRAYISVYLIRPESVHLFVVKLFIKAAVWQIEERKGKSFMVLGRPKDPGSCSWCLHRHDMCQKVRVYQPMLVKVETMAAAAYIICIIAFYYV